jgi:hypothetical protein
MKFRIEGLRSFTSLVKELALGMRRLDFSNNFEGFETTVTIPATSELNIRNELKFIPSRYIIFNQTGNGLITKGTTTWSTDFVYLYNNGAVEVTATIQFLR